MYWIDVDKLIIKGLSLNPKEMELLKENQDKLNWCHLSLNPNAIELLKENPDKIYWINISINPNIFEPIVSPIYKEELIATVFHPTRFARYLYAYKFDINDL